MLDLNKLKPDNSFKKTKLVQQKMGDCKKKMFSVEGNYGRRK